MQFEVKVRDGECNEISLLILSESDFDKRKLASCSRVNLGRVFKVGWPCDPYKCVATSHLDFSRHNI